jgi:hypothetical protein
VRPPGWPELHASLARWLEFETPIGDGMGMRLALWRAYLGVAPFTWHEGRIEAGVALGLGAGRMNAEGIGYAGARLAEQWLFDLDAGAWIRLRIVGALFVGAGANGFFPLVRARVTYTGSAGVTEEAFRAFPVGVLGFLGLGYLFSS